MSESDGAAAATGMGFLPKVWRLGAFSPGFEQYAALLASIRRWRGKTAGHWSQTPFLDIGFDKHEAHLAKVHMHRARPVGPNGWEEILRLEPVRDVVDLLPVAGEEYCA
jgi:hypothetical protein